MIWTTCWKVWNLLTSHARRQILKLVSLSSVLALLDLLGISTIFLAIMTSFSEMNIQTAGGLPEWLISIKIMNNLTYQSKMVILIVIVLIFFLSKSLLGLYIARKVFERIALYSIEIGNDYIRRLFKMNFSFISQRRSQKMLQAITGGIETLFVNFLGGFVTICVESIFAVIVLSFILILQPEGMISLLLVLVVTLGILNRYLGSRYRYLSRELTDALVDSNQLFLDGLSIFREIQLRNQENFIIEEVCNGRTATVQIKAKLFQLQNVTKYVIEIALVIGSIFFTLFRGGDLSVSSTLQSAFILLIAAGRILPSMLKIHSSILQMKQTTGSAQNALILMDEVDKSLLLLNDESASTSNLVPQSKSKTVLKVENLSYEFAENDNSRRAVRIENIDFQLEFGETLCIFGETGCGKTTLVELILGFRTPTEGKVEIWGLNPNDAITKFPGKISYVPQTSTILNMSTARNIALTRDYDSRIISETIVQSELGAVISEEEIENVLLGERGNKLSGGERQRIGLARGLYTNPSILFLDEATSALDKATEQRILANLKSISSMAVVFITHNIENLKFADKIFYMNKGSGKVYERNFFLGKLQELMKDVSRVSE